MMLWFMGGKTAQNYYRLQFCRANVLFVLNLTHDNDIVQFSTVHSRILIRG